MADNAIDKLIEETRAAYAEADRINAEIRALDEQRLSAQDQFAQAKKRCKLLDLTMSKHIHGNMPIVQAKMQAHEEIENERSNFGQSWANAASAASSASTAQTQTHIAALNRWAAYKQHGYLKGFI